MNNLVAQFNTIKSTLARNVSKLEDIRKELCLVEAGRKLLIDFTEYNRTRIKEKLEKLVNLALRCIFADKQIEFVLLPNKTKRGVVYEMYCRTDGVLTELSDSHGGGVLDVVSLALRISFLRIFSSKLRQTMILDEPFKNLDSERIGNAILWLKNISKDFAMQFIIVTHIEALVDNSDKVFRVSINNGASEVVDA
jgi:DNA repair exonuclease SbcCD ATPase subunit